MRSAEQSVRKRRRETHYIDALRSGRRRGGASAYSVRAKSMQPCSASLERTKLRSAPQLVTFTLETMLGRVRKSAI
jgi:DNA primase